MYIGVNLGEEGEFHQFFHAHGLYEEIGIAEGWLCVEENYGGVHKFRIDLVHFVIVIPRGLQDAR